MAVYGVEASGCTTDVLKWPNKKEAHAAGNSWLLVESAKELSEASISTKLLADIWNAHNPTENLKRFADREVGAEKVFALFPKIAITQKEFYKAQEAQSAEDEEMAKTATKTGSKPAAPGTAGTANAGKAAKKGAAATGAKKGNPNLPKRVGKFAGKKLFPMGSAKKDNPRRAGSHGHKSMQIVMDNPGIVYEDFVKKGGRPNDIAWDVEKGFAEAK